jgi:hypothetical protein
VKLYVIAYPELSEADFNRIEACRRANDRLYGLVPLHFTFVFAVEDFTEGDFVAEIKKQVKGTASIPFTIRCATVNKDDFSDNYFTFLVPDEGYSGIVKLHDKLYNDKLLYHRRLDIDYIPHIEIANNPDKMFIKSIADEWNDANIEIKGIISSIHIVSFENRILTTIEKIILP